MPVLFTPVRCPWSPDPIAGPLTERSDRAWDTDAPDGGAGRGELVRVRRGSTAQPGRLLGLAFTVAGLPLDAPNDAAAVAAWRMRNRPGRERGRR